ncbi:MAG TPA: hypothetical protein VFQ41_22255 [Candidatus Angelobacter sp.]|nr:hypothetical protein [Candidatus Angelobacter sp.]
MRKNARAIEILLAGPSDVKRELQVARDVIEAWNAAHSHAENTLLQAIYWDTHAFPEIGDRPQGVINRQLVDRCDLLIAVFWKSIGSPTGVASSGTIEEIERFRDSGRPVMLYFSEARLPHDADITKVDQVREYRKSLNNGLYWAFKSPARFRERLTVHLPQAIARFREGTAPDREMLPNGWLQDKNAALNRIQAELETTQVVNDFPLVLEKLRPLVLDCIALPKVSRIKEARQNLQFLTRRITEMGRFSFISGTIAEFGDKRDELFSDIRAAFEQAAAIESLNEWEVVRYEDLKARRAEHTTETAWNWPDDKQCQCADCAEFRSLKLKIQDALNPKFRAFFLKLKEQFSQLRKNNFEPSNVWAWIDSVAKSAKRFQECFQIQEQSQNCHLAERVVHVFGQFKNVPIEDRKKYTAVDFEKMFMTVEPLVQMFEGLDGPA